MFRGRNTKVTRVSCIKLSQWKPCFYLILANAWNYEVYLLQLALNVQSTQLTDYKFNEMNDGWKKRCRTKVYLNHNTPFEYYPQHETKVFRRRKLAQ